MIVELRAQVAGLEAQVAALQVLVVELRARLDSNSRTSSKPPSSDGPGAAPRNQPKSGRSRGGQKGHRGSSRDRLAPTAVQHVIPDRCSSCERPLRGTDPAPAVHQVMDLPVIVPEVTDYHLHALGCRCGKVTRATLPAGVSSSAFGPRIIAMTSLLTGRYHVTKRGVVEVFRDVFGIKLALGTVSRLERTTSASMEAAVDEARVHVWSQPVLHADETGWRQRNAKAWLWTAATQTISVYRVDLSRSREAAMKLLGSFSGTLVTDRYSAYAHWEADRHQLCWAHILRTFEGIAEHPQQDARAIGARLVDATRAMFHAWHQMLRGEITREDLAIRVEAVKVDIDRALRDGVQHTSRRVWAKCDEVLKSWGSLWTFVTTPGVEPTNNLAERRIRPAVCWRKTSFGTQSEAGSRFVERILTVCASLHAQQRTVFQWLVTAVQRHAGAPGRPLTLLPSPS